MQVMSLVPEWNLPRILAATSIILTIVSVTVAVLACRRASPVRIARDLTRVAVSAAAIVVMAVVTGVSTPAVAVAGAIAAGVALGSAQGWFTKVAMVESRLVAQKSAIGVAAWGLGIAVAQGAGVAARTGAVQLGQGLSWLGLALLVGTLLGRQRRITKARTRGAALAGLFLLGLALTSGAFTARSAAADEGAITTGDICALLPSGPGWEQHSETLWCHAYLEYDPDGIRSADDYSVSLTASYNPAFDHAAVGPFSAQFADDPSVTGFPEGIGDDAYERETPWRLDVRFYRGPIWAEAAVNGNLAAAPGARDLARDIDARAIQLLAEQEAAGPGTGTSEPPAGTGSTPTTTGAASGTTQTSAGSDAGHEGSVPVPPTGSAGSDEDVTAPEALVAATAGLAGSVLVALVSIAEAGGLGVNIGGERRLPPDLVVRGGGPSVPGTGAGVAAPPTPPTATVIVTGPAAEAAIRDGVGSTVPIPADQQWDEHVSVEGEPPIRDRRVGSHGMVKSVGPVVRGPDGQVSVAVEVEPFEQAPPPDIELQPITTPGDPAEMAPPRPPPLDESPPVDEPPAPAARFGDDEIWGAIDHGMDDLAGTDDLGTPPDAGVPPGAAGAEPPAVEAAGAPQFEEEPPPPALEDEPPPPALDEEPPPPALDEEAPPDDGPPAEGASDVRLTPEQIDEIVRWGRNINRSRADILGDLAAANQGAGGSGAVEIPEWFDSEYEQYAGALRERDTLRQQKESIRERVAELERQAQHWTTVEQLTELRAVAGMREVIERQAEYEALRADLIAERARLAGLPGREAEIAEVDGQLAWLEEDHARTMRPGGIVGDQNGRPADQSGVADVAPAEGLDRGTAFDRPARELERIARQRDELLAEYRGVDAQLDEAERTIQDYEGPGAG